MRIKYQALDESDRLRLLSLYGSIHEILLKLKDCSRLSDLRTVLHSFPVRNREISNGLTLGARCHLRSLRRMAPQGLASYPLTSYTVFSHPHKLEKSTLLGLVKSVLTRKIPLIERRWIPSMDFYMYQGSAHVIAILETC